VGEDEEDDVFAEVGEGEGHGGGGGREVLWRCLGIGLSEELGHAWELGVGFVRAGMRL
jgi:hypothetical protein